MLPNSSNFTKFNNDWKRQYNYNNHNVWLDNNNTSSINNSNSLGINNNDRQFRVTISPVAEEQSTVSEINIKSQNTFKDLNTSIRSNQNSISPTSKPKFSAFNSPIKSPIKKTSSLKLNKFPLTNVNQRISTVSDLRRPSNINDINKKISKLYQDFNKNPAEITITPNVSPNPKSSMKRNVSKNNYNHAIIITKQ